MVTCYEPYPASFQGHRALLLSSINSGPARYDRICRYHPGVRDRVDESWLLGYPTHYPVTLLCCKYIPELLNYHKTVLNYRNLTVDNITSLIKIMGSLKKVHLVSYIFLLTPDFQKNIGMISL